MVRNYTLLTKEMVIIMEKSNTIIYYRYETGSNLGPGTLGTWLRLLHQDQCPLEQQNTKKLKILQA